MAGAWARHGSTSFRFVSGTEVTLFVGSILAFMWFVQPVTGRAVHVAYYLVMLGFVWLSAAARGETLRTVGLRVDNLGPAVWRVLPPTCAIAFGVAFVGWALRVHPRIGPALASVPPYVAWCVFHAS